MEEWRKIEGFEGYEVSNIGGIRSLKSGATKRLKIYNRQGYHRVTLWGDGKRYDKGVHRLVAIAFIENPLNKSQVNHKNGIKSDNRVKNLEWCTASENNRHKVYELNRLGSVRKPKPVYQISLDGRFIAKFDSLANASRAMGQKQATSIWLCTNGRGKTSAGFRWMYEEDALAFLGVSAK